MLVYSYDNLSYYSGSEEARVSPLDGISLVPTNATLVEPTNGAEGYTWKWNGTSWDLVELKTIPHLDPDKNKFIIFFVQEEGKDTAYIGWSLKSKCWDYVNDEPLWEGAPLPATIGYSLFTTFSEAGLFNEWQIAVKKVVEGSLVDRAAQTIIDESDVVALNQLRITREGKIQEVEWLRFRHKDQIDMGVSTTLTSGQYEELLEYIQALRDLPETAVDPKAPVWPTEPEWM